jgi:hypothetical protein
MQNSRLHPIEDDDGFEAALRVVKTSLWSLTHLDELLVEFPELAVPPCTSSRSSHTPLQFVRDRLDSHPQLIPPAAFECLITIFELLVAHPKLLAKPLSMNEDEEPTDFFGETLNHFACQHFFSVELIQAFIDLCPIALFITDSNGYTPLDLLVMRHAVSVDIVREFTVKYPDYFILPSREHRSTPLHAACQHGNMQVITLLATTFPETCFLRTLEGETPLSLVCRRGPATSVDAVRALLYAYRQALTMINFESLETPLFKACHTECCEEVILLLAHEGPRAIRMLNHKQKSVLDACCENALPLDTTVRYIYEQYEVACLILASVQPYLRIQDWLPYEFCRYRYESNPPFMGWDQEEPLDALLLDTMAGWTLDTAFGLIECVYCSFCTITSAHVREFITALRIPDFFDETASGVAEQQSIRPYMRVDMVHDLVNDEHIQEFILKDEFVANLIGGLIRMNRAGRDYVQEESSNLKKGVLVLESVSYNVECLFLHLRENSSFFPT